MSRLVVDFMIDDLERSLDGKFEGKCSVVEMKTRSFCAAL